MRSWIERELAFYAPKAEATDGEARNPGPRMRKRGPRSNEGFYKRASWYNQVQMFHAQNTAAELEKQFREGNAREMVML